MKHLFKFFSHHLIPITLFIGGGGSILFGISPLIGSILIILSVLTGLFSYYQSENGNDRSRYLMEGLAHLLAENQLGNVYIEALRAEIREKGYSRKAKLLSQKALSLNPKDHKALEFFTSLSALEISRITLFNRGKYDKIITAEVGKIRKLAIQGAKLYPTSYVFHDVLGILLDLEGKHERARKEFMHSGKLRSDSYWEWEIATSFGLSGNHGKALEALERARGKGATAGLFSLYYGRALHAVGECERAEEELQKARKEYRWLPEILKALSNLYFDQGKFLSTSKFSLMTGFSLMQTSWFGAFIYFREALIGLYLFVLCFISKKLWLVVKWIPLIKSVQLRFLPPDEPEFGLGKKLIAKRCFNLAEKHFRAACKIVPSNAGNFGNLAVTLFRQGKIKEAIEANAIALRLEPEKKEFKHNKEVFEGKIGGGESLRGMPNEESTLNLKGGKFEDLKNEGT